MPPRKPVARLALVFAALLGLFGAGVHLFGRAAAAADTTVAASLLLVSTDGSEPSLAAMRAELDRIGTPYTVVTTSSGAVTGAALSDGAGHGNFNGIVLARCGGGVPDAGTAAALADYASSYGVRSACLYARADAAFGLGAPSSTDTRATPLALTYTAAGAAVFGAYTTTTSLAVSGVDAAVAPIADAGATTALLVDANGNAAAAIHRAADGSEQLVVTFDQAPGSLHARQLLCGLLGWVTRGVYIGEKRATLGAQVDDVFLGTVTRSGPIYRLGGDDLQAAARWQQQVQSTPLTAGVRLTFAFNGVEVTDSDGLTQAAKSVGQQFQWVSHTFDHHRLDVADYTRMTWELTQNDGVMQKYMFGPYDRASLVTPDISALANAQVLQASVDFGITRIICDGSQSNCRGEIPNTGLPNPLQPGLLMVPRIANNLYADVSTPAEWIDYYDTLQGGGARTVDQILDTESDTLVGYLLDGNLDPWMFHQANLRLYDGTHALLTDLLDRTIAKYAALRALPVMSPTMEETGQRMLERAQRERAGVTATIHPGQSITLQATAAARVPVTGAAGDGAESYGALVITRADVPGGGAITIPLAAGPGGADAGADGGIGRGAFGAGGAGSSGCGCRLGAPGASADAVALLLSIGLLLATRATRPRGGRRRPSAGAGCRSSRAWRRTCAATCRAGAPRASGSRRRWRARRRSDRARRPSAGR
jgi:hypothetical protein